MKKLMIAVAIVCAAVAANAAAINWKSGAITGPDGVTKVKKLVDAQLFIIDSVTYDSLKSTDAATVSQNIQTWAAGKTATASGTTGSTSQITLTNDGTIGTKYYAALLYTYTGDDTYKDSFMGNLAEATPTSDAGIDISGLGSVLGGAESGSTTATAWVAAPEPTSGLLLLLGMGALALRRRRA